MLGNWRCSLIKNAVPLTVVFISGLLLCVLELKDDPSMLSIANSGRLGDL